MGSASGGHPLELGGDMASETGECEAAGESGHEYGRGDSPGQAWATRRRSWEPAEEALAGSKSMITKGWTGPETTS